MYCHIANRIFNIQDAIVRKTSVRTLQEVRAELAHIEQLKKNPAMASKAKEAEQDLYDWAIGETDGGGSSGRTFRKFLTPELMNTIDTQYQQHRGDDAWVMIGQKHGDWSDVMADYAEAVGEAVRLHTEQVLLQDHRRRQESGLDDDDEEDDEVESEHQQQPPRENEDPTPGVVQLLAAEEKEMIRGMAARAFVLLSISDPTMPTTLVPLMTRQVSIDLKQILTWNELGWAEVRTLHRRRTHER